MSSLLQKKQTGFSLIELVTVLLIITVLSTVAIRSTVDIGYAGRYEQTRDRVENIRKAIVGDPNRSIAGQPDIFGFVADMGRLPKNLHELLEANYCETDRNVTDPVICAALNAGTGVWVPQALTTVDMITQLKYGWNGPYLNISDNPSDQDAYTDGWGREAQGYCSEPSIMLQVSCEVADTWTDAIADHNYGWYYDANSIFPILIISSYGKDNIFGTTNDDYDEDYPLLADPGFAPTGRELIKGEDWQVDISNGIQVTFSAPITIDSNDRSACIKAGGNWKTACEIDQAKCETVTGVTTPDLLGNWVSANGFNFCKMNEGVAGLASDAPPGESCKAQRGTNELSGSWKTCHFLSEQSCQLARGVWREKYTANTETTCNEVTGSIACDNFTRQQCEAAAGVWENNRCYTCDIITTANCSASGGMATASSYPNGLLIPMDRDECRKAGGNWDMSSGICLGANFCEFDFDHSQNCRDSGGNWSESCFYNFDACTDATLGGIALTWNSAQAECSTDLPAQLLFNASEASYELQNIVLQLAYRDSSGLEIAHSTGTIVQEDGKTQTILFSNFKKDTTVATPDNGTDVDELPIGINGILITKNYNPITEIGDIYPASCAGLDGDSDGNTITDCVESGGTLLDNNLCDNVTLLECTTGADGTSGTLIRTVMKLPFVPRKAVPLINW